MKFLICIWLLILLGCSSGTISIGQRLIKQEILDITLTEEGYCKYTIQPRPNHKEYIVEACGKYNIGDSLYYTELYEIKK